MSFFHSKYPSPNTTPALLGYNRIYYKKTFPPSLSYPRKRVSIGFPRQKTSKWIPAFAGMTKKPCCMQFPDDSKHPDIGRESVPIILSEKRGNGYFHAFGPVPSPGRPVVLALHHGRRPDKYSNFPYCT
jgi:hypothetical protein